MKKAFLLIVVPALLVALGFAQTPAPSTNTDPTTIKGCLGGSDGNYTVVEDNTGHIFKITASSVDLKPHLSHDVTLIGNKASGASSAPADISFAVIELNMISEHCAAAAAAPTATVSAPSETGSTPAAGATPPPAAVSTLPESAVTPATPATQPTDTAVTPAAAATPPAAAVTPADATPPAETAVTPAVAPTTPVATVSTPSETAATPAARHRKRSETPAAATTTPAATASSSSESEPVGKPAAAATTPAAIAGTPSEPASTPAAVATTPAAASKGWSLWLWIAFAVLVVVIGTTFPFVNRWRKRKSLERTGTPNLSFIREASPGQAKADKGKSDQSEGDPTAPRKAA